MRRWRTAKKDAVSRKPSHNDGEYRYYVTAWKDGKHVETVDVWSRKIAFRIADEFTNGRRCVECDCVDVCKMNSAMQLNEKTYYTLDHGQWRKFTDHVGEDE